MYDADGRLTVLFAIVGKPHPRWADGNFRDGDPNEKWHSRATKCAPQVKRLGNPPEGDDPGGPGRGIMSSLLTPIKTEAPSDTSHPQLYRFSPSPAPSMRYHTFQTDIRAPSSSSFENDQRQSYTGQPSGNSPVSYQSSSSSHPYDSQRSGPLPYSGGSGSGGGGYSVAEDDRVYGDRFSHSSSPPAFCSCRTSPATGHAYIALSQQLQSTLNALRQYSQHPPNSPCLLYRRIVELNNLMQYVSSHALTSLRSPDLFSCWEN